MPATPLGSSPTHTDFPALSLKGITRHFGGVRALSSVDFEVEASEVHALVGENGAGKSTLIRILTGDLQPSEGTIELGGRKVRFDNPEEAQAAGIAAVYQESPLLELRAVAENIYFNREPRRRGAPGPM